MSTREWLAIEGRWKWCGLSIVLPVFYYCSQYVYINTPTSSLNLPRHKLHKIRLGEVCISSFSELPSLRLPALSISLSHIQSVVVLQRHRNWWFPPLQFQNRAKTGEALRIAHCFVCFSWHVQKMTTQSENNSFVTGTQICNGGREKPTFSSSIFSLRGRPGQSSFQWSKQVQPLLITWKESVLVTNVTLNFDRSSTLTLQRETTCIGVSKTFGEDCKYVIILVMPSSETQGQLVGSIKCSWWKFTVRLSSSRSYSKLSPRTFYRRANCPWVPEDDIIHE